MRPHGRPDTGHHAVKTERGTGALLMSLRVTGGPVVELALLEAGCLGVQRRRWLLGSWGEGHGSSFQAG